MAGIYVHIPFCHSKCAYCDFYSSAQRSSLGDVARALAVEWGMRCREVAEPVTTVYFGGGTPSILDAGTMRTIVEALPLQGVEEFTIEANPEDITRTKVQAWIDMGVNRVSMGVQSLVDSELALISRRHSARQALEAVDVIRQAGIANISLDLIYGLPSQTIETWTYSLRTLLDLRPEHFSAYMLSYEPRTRLHSMLRAGRIVPVDEEVLVEMYALLTDEARARGYAHYEISNFALPGYKSRHNSSYWTSTPYIGLGPAAHSFDGTVRRVNPPSISQYLGDILSGRNAFEIDEETDTDRYNDMIITSLRTAGGIDLRAVPPHRLERLMRDAAPYIESGTVVVDDGRMRIPEHRWLVSDAVMRDLCCFD